MKTELLLEVLVLLSPIMAVVGVIVGIIRFKMMSGEHLVLWIYLLVAVAADVANRMLAEWQGDNLIMLPLFGLLEYILFAWLYYHFLLKSKSKVLFSILCLIGAVLLFDLLTADTSNPATFQSYGRVLDGLSIIGLSLFFFRKIMLEQRPEHRRYMGLNSGIMLFFLINSLWFLALNFLINHSLEMLYYIWMINAIATPLFYCFLTWHIWQSGKIQKP